MVAGFYGLLDFAGYPTGYPLVFPPPRGKGKAGAGHRVLARLLMAQQLAEAWAQRVQAPGILERATVALRLNHAWEYEISRRQKMLTTGMIATVLLAEV